MREHMSGPSPHDITLLSELICLPALLSWGAAIVPFIIKLTPHKSRIIKIGLVLLENRFLASSFHFKLLLVTPVNTLCSLEEVPLHTFFTYIHDSQ